MTPTHPSLQFYRATRFIFPRHFTMRAFAICFVATHVPLIAFAGVELVRGDFDVPVFLALLAATLAGTLFGIAGLAGLLQPISLATSQLRRVQAGERVEAVPRGGDDMVGQLLEGVACAARSTEARIEVLKGVAGTDPLTGLFNRRGFQEALREALAQDGRGGVLALLDGDGFKQVNDRLGHDKGDEVLRAIAARIGDSIREKDVAARWGGDEFVIYFPGLVPDQAERIVARVKEALERRPPATIDGTPVTVSAGLARLGGAGRRHLDAAMKRADEAMYARKEARKRAA